MEDDGSEACLTLSTTDCLSNYDDRSELLWLWHRNMVPLLLSDSVLWRHMNLNQQFRYVCVGNTNINLDTIVKDPKPKTQEH